MLGAAFAVDALDAAVSTTAATADLAEALPRAVLLTLLATVSVLLPISVLRAGSIALIEVHVPAPSAQRYPFCARCTPLRIAAPLYTPLHPSAPLCARSATLCLPPTSAAPASTRLSPPTRHPPTTQWSSQSWGWPTCQG